jgi:quinol monooxygenase YgiN
MAGFVQIIEFKTSRIDEVRQLVEEMRAQQDPVGSMRGTAAADRDRPGYYLNIVEFESYEAAMENSARPEISQFAARMAALCDEPPRFHNLDVVETWEGDSGGPSMKTVVAGAATAAAGVAAAAAVKSRSGSGPDQPSDTPADS